MKGRNSDEENSDFGVKNMAADSNYFCDADSCQTHASRSTRKLLQAAHTRLFNASVAVPNSGSRSFAHPHSRSAHCYPWKEKTRKKIKGEKVKKELDIEEFGSNPRAGTPPEIRFESAWFLLKMKTGESSDPEDGGMDVSVRDAVFPSKWAYLGSKYTQPSPQGQTVFHEILLVHFPLYWFGLGGIASALRFPRCLWRLREDAKSNLHEEDGLVELNFLPKKLDNLNKP